MVSPTAAKTNESAGQWVALLHCEDATWQSAAVHFTKMHTLELHAWHQQLRARFQNLNEFEAVADYGDWQAEFTALTASCGVIDLGFRSRICLLGADRVRFLHGQVTNDIKHLAEGGGCYAFITSAKGKLQSDAFIYRLENEILLDFEPGLAVEVSRRLETFIVSDDVQVVDVRPHYGLLSIQGPTSAVVIMRIAPELEVPANSLQIVQMNSAAFGECYVANQPRLGSQGFDIFAPAQSLQVVAQKLLEAVREQEGRPCGWTAFDAVRIRAGVPRFGVDMDESNLPQETGLEKQAISYHKGCYIGQEVINRIHSIGRVNKYLRRFELLTNPPTTPLRGDKFLCDDRDAGFLTSVVRLPDGSNVALGYLQSAISSDANKPVSLRAPSGDVPVRVLGAVGWDPDR